MGGTFGVPELIFIGVCILVALLFFKRLFITEEENKEILDKQVEQTSGKINRGFLIFGAILILGIMIVMVLAKY